MSIWQIRPIDLLSIQFRLLKLEVNILDISDLIDETIFFAKQHK